MKLRKLTKARVNLISILFKKKQKKKQRKKNICVTNSLKFYVFVIEHPIHDQILKEDIDLESYLMKEGG